MVRGLPHWDLTEDKIVLQSVPKSKRSSLLCPHICAESIPAPAEASGSGQAVWCSPDGLFLGLLFLGLLFLGRPCLGGRRTSFWGCVYIGKNLICQIFLHMIWFLKSDLSKAETCKRPTCGIRGCVFRAVRLNTGLVPLLLWLHSCSAKPISKEVQNFIGKSECNVDIISSFVQDIVQEATFTWCTLLLVTSVFSFMRRSCNKSAVL